MNKSELIEAIINESSLTKEDSVKFIDSFTKVIINALKSGEEVVIPTFGSFKPGMRAARKGRNPQTGAEIQIKASRVATFKAGKLLKEAMQEV
jgi:DNA-binding protein HU-beta